jgi:hypothetical protein
LSNLPDLPKTVLIQDFLSNTTYLLKRYPNVSVTFAKRLANVTPNVTLQDLKTQDLKTQDLKTQEQDGSKHKTKLQLKVEQRAAEKYGRKP